MLNSLISWSIQNRFIVLVLAAVLIFCGVHMSSKADIDVQQVALVWLPYRVDAAGKAIPAY